MLKNIDLNKILDVTNRKPPANLDISEKNINIGYVGQLYQPKGVHFLVQAFAELSNEYKNIRLYIVGDCIIDEYKEYENRLKDMAKNYVIDDRIVFTGWRDDSLNIINVLDIVMLINLILG